MDKVLTHGRTPPIHRPAPRGRKDGSPLPRVRDLAGHRLQDLRAVEELRSRGPQRPLTAPVPPRQRAPLPGRADDSLARKGAPFLGAPKIRDKRVCELPMIQAPAVSTVHAVLDRNGLVKRRKRRRHKARERSLWPPISRMAGDLHTPSPRAYAPPPELYAMRSWRIKISRSARCRITPDVAAPHAAHEEDPPGDRIPCGSDHSHAGRFTSPALSAPARRPRGSHCVGSETCDRAFAERTILRRSCRSGRAGARR